MTTTPKPLSSVEEDGNFIYEVIVRYTRYAAEKSSGTKIKGDKLTASQAKAMLQRLMDKREIEGQIKALNHLPSDVLEDVNEGAIDVVLGDEIEGHIAKLEQRLKELESK